MTRKWEFKQKGNAGIEKFNALWTVCIAAFDAETTMIVVGLLRGERCADEESVGIYRQD